MARRTPEMDASHLSLPWRRRCVSLIGVSAVAIVLLNLSAAVPSPLRYGASLLLSGAIGAGAWLLSDIARLWRDERLLSEAERVHRDRSVVRAYFVLAWLCIGLAVCLHLPAFADTEPAAVAHGRTLTLAWALLAATITLPGMTAAWSESLPADRTIGPAQLVRERFRSGDAPAHAATLVLVLVAVGLLALLVLPARQQATVRIWAVAVASLAVLIAGLLVARPLLREVRAEPPTES